MLGLMSNFSVSYTTRYRVFPICKSSHNTFDRVRVTIIIYHPLMILQYTVRWALRIHFLADPP